MTKNKFSEIWDNIIIPIFNEMNINGELYMRKGSFSRIYNEYQKQKNYLKTNYMQNPNTHIDRHKIAACMMKAIVLSSPIKIKHAIIWSYFIQKNHFPFNYILLNEYLGLYVAFSIVESFRIYEKDETKKRNGICLPNTTNGEDYVYNTCLDLYFSKKKKNINILTFANVFFLLETGSFPNEK